MVSDYQQLHQYGTGSRTELYWNECHRRQEEYQYGCMCVCGCAHNSTKELPAKQKRHSPETMQWKRIFQIGVRAARQKHRKRPHTQNSQALSSNMANYFHIYEPGPPGRTLAKQCSNGKQNSSVTNTPPTRDSLQILARLLGFSLSARRETSNERRHSRCATSGAHFLCMQLEGRRGKGGLERGVAMNRVLPATMAYYMASCSDKDVPFWISAPAMHVLVPENRHDEPSAKVAGLYTDRWQIPSPHPHLKSAKNLNDISESNLPFWAINAARLLIDLCPRNRQSPGSCQDKNASASGPINNFDVRRRVPKLAAVNRTPKRPWA